MTRNSNEFLLFYHSPIIHFRPRTIAITNQPLINRHHTMHINLKPITSKLQLATARNQPLINIRIQLKQAIKRKAYEIIERLIVVEFIKSPLITQQATHYRQLIVDMQATVLAPRHIR